MELEDYRDVLEFIPEYQLTSEPLRIDCVIVKKKKGAVIGKNIGAIFRERNLLEYKSPDAYVSVEDFYKVYGYACLYSFLNRFPMDEMTLSFIGSRYPRKLVEHLKRERGYTVAETGPGIYTVSGDMLPVQIIDSRKLSDEENLWLKGLNGGHDGRTLDRIESKIKEKEKDARLGAYLHAIIHANSEAAEEVMKMRDRFDEVIEKTGLAAKWEARARAETEARCEAKASKEREVLQKEIAANKIEIARLREQLIMKIMKV